MYIVDLFHNGLLFSNQEIVTHLVSMTQRTYKCQSPSTYKCMQSPHSILVSRHTLLGAVTHPPPCDELQIMIKLVKLSPGTRKTRKKVCRMGTVCTLPSIE